MRSGLAGTDWKERIPLLTSRFRSRSFRSSSLIAASSPAATRSCARTNSRSVPDDKSTCTQQQQQTQRGRPVTAAERISVKQCEMTDSRQRGARSAPRCSRSDRMPTAARWFLLFVAPPVAAAADCCSSVRLSDWPRRDSASPLLRPPCAGNRRAHPATRLQSRTAGPLRIAAIAHMR